jgi:hypothetical protein
MVGRGQETTGGVTSIFGMIAGDFSSVGGRTLTFTLALSGREEGGINEEAGTLTAVGLRAVYCSLSFPTALVLSILIFGRLLIDLVLLLPPSSAS